MFSGHLWLTSYTAKLRKRSGSCHQSGRRRRDCSSPLLTGVRKHEKQHYWCLAQLQIWNRNPAIVFYANCWYARPCTSARSCQRERMSSENLGAKWAQNPVFLSANRGMAGE
jgi:hypothetical protein